MPQRDDAAAVDTAALRDLLDGRWAAVRRRAREVLRGPEFAPRHGLGMEEHRAPARQALSSKNLCSRVRSSHYS